MIEVYSKNKCVQCKMVKSLLDNGGVSYKETNIDENPGEKERLKALGVKAAPAVFKDGKLAFVGFSPEKVKNVIKNSVNS